MSASTELATVSVVIVSLNEGADLLHTVESLAAALPSGGEIVVVDDGSTDGSADFLTNKMEFVTLLSPSERLGVARARNFGAERARGEVLVFSDAHIAVPPHCFEPLLAELARHDMGAVAPGVSIMQPAPTKSTGFGQKWRDATLDTSWLGGGTRQPHPVPLLGGGFVAVRHDVFAAAGGFDSGMLIWGAEDTEFCIRLWTFGYECWVVPDVEVAHRFRPKRPYEVPWEPVLHNKLRLASIHFGPERLRRVVDRLKENAAFPTAESLLASSDVITRSSFVRSARQHDDDWFFGKFRDELACELSGPNSPTKHSASDRTAYAATS